MDFDDDETVGPISDEIKVLAQGPNHIARRFKAFAMDNGYKFRTEQYEREMNTQNSRVMVLAKTESYARKQDTRPKLGDVNYYGRLTDIIELNYYGRFKVVLFRCDSIDVTQGRGIRKDSLGFTIINFSRLTHTGDHLNDEPFVFPSQAEQVIFVQDPKDREWFIPRQIIPRDAFDWSMESGP
ncbi:hypothetical protein COCNU_10G006450 [Cocos nucifera]|uniref:DUF4216 domain-containing protein n=1 Tax=Cocos nucifera TaxID=13894 RepID=A0A8K0N8H1_COCNU|nr:hypothetical protein COCNU_10G006450 [Cocos nucifera]